MTEAVIDLTYLEHSCAGNVGLMKQIVNLFLTKTTPRLAELQTNISQQNWEEVRSGAHKIKTSYNSIGSKEVAAVLEDIEISSQSQSEINQEDFLSKFSFIEDRTLIIYQELEKKLKEFKD